MEFTDPKPASMDFLDTGGSGHLLISVRVGQNLSWWSYIVHIDDTTHQLSVDRIHVPGYEESATYGGWLTPLVSTANHGQGGDSADSNLVFSIESETEVLFQQCTLPRRGSSSSNASLTTAEVLHSLANPVATLNLTDSLRSLGSTRNQNTSVGDGDVPYIVARDMFNGTNMGVVFGWNPASKNEPRGMLYGFLVVPLYVAPPPPSPAAPPPAAPAIVNVTAKPIQLGYGPEDYFFTPMIVWSQAHAQLSVLRVDSASSTSTAFHVYNVTDQVLASSTGHSEGAAAGVVIKEPRNLTTALIYPNPRLVAGSGFVFGASEEEPYTIVGLSLPS
ncbi:hypothetical protein HK101_005644 [Irineochytrium annulatum]|nr:hypothetical protein HK101_005644 [Irineochytrium annulatum]